MIRPTTCSILTLLLATGLTSAPALHAAGSHVESHAGSHAHETWVAAPAEYSDLQGGAVWYDDEAASRGSEIYATQCQTCHGVTGRGDGVVAASLDHKPADLTRHKHSIDGSTDGYLFWRVSEGGTAAPFNAQNSAMPAFKALLDEQQRWDVLAFIHKEFHREFAQMSASGDMGMGGMEPMSGQHDAGSPDTGHHADDSEQNRDNR